MCKVSVPLLEYRRSVYYFILFPAYVSMQYFNDESFYQMYPALLIIYYNFLSRVHSCHEIEHRFYIWFFSQYKGILYVLKVETTRTCSLCIDSHLQVHEN